LVSASYARLELVNRAFRCIRAAKAMRLVAR
jgi:hypothetical protein